MTTALLITVIGLQVSILTSIAALAYWLGGKFKDGEARDNRQDEKIKEHGDWIESERKRRETGEIPHIVLARH